MGDRVLVREIVRLVNPGRRVIQLAKGDGRERGAGTHRLPSAIVDCRPRLRGRHRPRWPTASRSRTASSGMSARSTPATKASNTSTACRARRRASVCACRSSSTSRPARVVAVAGTAGMPISGPGLVASSEVSSDSGKRLEAWARGALGAREETFFEAALPETRLDPALVSIPRADVWLDLDDTRLTATVDIQLEVAPGAPVAGTPAAPLLSVTLPEGASLTGVAPEAEALGLVPRDRGGFDVIGPDRRRRHEPRLRLSPRREARRPGTRPPLPTQGGDLERADRRYAASPSTAAASIACAPSARAPATTSTAKPSTCCPTRPSTCASNHCAPADCRAKPGWPSCSPRSPVRRRS